MELNPYFIKGYFALGNSLLFLNRNEDAVKQYLKALEINPADPEVHHNLGVGYSRAGDKEKAIKEFEKAIEIEPSYGLAYMSLAGMYANQGNAEKAEEIEKKWKEYAETHLQTPKEEQEPAVSSEESG